MLDLPFRSAKQLAADIRRKKIGCLELLDAYLARVDKYNPRLNAIVVDGSGRCAAPGARRRRRAREGEGLGPAPRCAHDGEGVVRRRRHAHDMGRARAQGQSAVAQCAGRGPPARRGRGALRQEQCAAHARRLAELQRGVRLHQQSLGSRAHAGRLLGRLGRRARRRPDGHRGGERHRRVDPESRALLRRLRPQADLRHRAAARPGAAGARGPGRTSPSSAPWRGAPTISPSGFPRWRAPTRSTGPAGSFACPRRGGSSSASTRSPSCSPTPVPRSTGRCRTGSRPSPTSSRRRRRG